MSDHETRIEHPLTFEFSFGAETENDSFLLAQPTNAGLAVDHSGRIIILDEQRLKVFNADGTPQRIVGWPGQGPGEFENAGSCRCSPTGFITVLGSETYSVFDRDFAFKKMERFRWNNAYKDLLRQRGFGYGHIMNPIVFGPDNSVYAVDGSPMKREEARRTFILHETKGGIGILAEYEDISSVYTENKSGNLPFLGRTIFAGLPDGRIVYTHSYYDREENGGRFYYTLHILSVADGTRRSNAREYRPVGIADVDFRRYEYEKERTGNAESDELYRAIKDKAAERQYKAPVQDIKTDGEYIFVFLYEQQDDRVKVDVFHAGSGAYLSSSYFYPVSSYLGIILYPNGVIRNGRYHTINDYYARETFPAVEVYTLNPKLYGK